MLRATNDRSMTTPTINDKKILFGLTCSVCYQWINSIKQLKLLCFDFFVCSDLPAPTHNIHKSGVLCLSEYPDP